MDVYVGNLWSRTALGCISHGKRIAPGDSAATQHSESIHRLQTNREYTVYMWTHTVGGSLKQRKDSIPWDRRVGCMHRTCQLRSSRQPSGNQTNHSHRVWSVERHCILNCAHTFSFLFYILKDFSHPDTGGLFHHLKHDNKLNEANAILAYCMHIHTQNQYQRSKT